MPRGTDTSGIMLVGEAPGAEEDASGAPFVGPAGQLLSKSLEVFNQHLREPDLWISNVVHCRPPDNRAPETEEIAACAHWLNKEIAYVRPWLIVALGKTAAMRLLPGLDLNRFVPQVGLCHYSTQAGHECLVLITYHPSYVMRKSEDADVVGAYARHFRWLASVAEIPQWYVRQLLKLGRGGPFSVDDPLSTAPSADGP